MLEYVATTEIADEELEKCHVNIGKGRIYVKQQNDNFRGRLECKSENRRGRRYYGL